MLDNYFFCFSKSQKIEADKNNVDLTKRDKFGTYGYLNNSVNTDYHRPLTLNSRTNFIFNPHIEVGSTKCIAFPGQNSLGTRAETPGEKEIH